MSSVVTKAERKETEQKDQMYEELFIYVQITNKKQRKKGRIYTDTFPLEEITEN